MFTFIYFLYQQVDLSLNEYVKYHLFFVILICSHKTLLTIIGINIVPYFKCSVYMKLFPCMLLMRHEHFLRSLSS